MATTENRNFLVYLIMVKKSILSKEEGFHSNVGNLELQGFYDSFVTYSKYLYSGLWDFWLWSDGQLPITAVHKSTLILLYSIRFFTVIGGPMEASGYFLLWSCINSEIVYKRALVSPLITVLQTQAQHWRHHARHAHYYTLHTCS